MRGFPNWLASVLGVALLTVGDASQPGSPAPQPKEALKSPSNYAVVYEQASALDTHNFPVYDIMWLRFPSGEPRAVYRIRAWETWSHDYLPSTDGRWLLVSENRYDMAKARDLSVRYRLVQLPDGQVLDWADSSLRVCSRRLPRYLSAATPPAMGRMPIASLSPPKTGPAALRTTSVNAVSPLHSQPGHLKALRTRGLCLPESCHIEGTRPRPHPKEASVPEGGAFRLVQGTADLRVFR